MSQFATFYENEKAARAALADYIHNVRKDWHVSEIVEVKRSDALTKEIGPRMCKASVAPFNSPNVPNVPGRFLMVTVCGQFARTGEPFSGMDSKEFVVCFPAQA